ncbi:hypothetical protein HPB47_024686 [Ixodes persulcatus]|uniref:Uncharacterized protein n=1 Tax=Ixodes persulcatus TaxID=34615 RepID=A0AC60Q462_IXOPE|nr:hypothetical protein HPB47_024686 [Ixodes persulcatus]
MVTNRKKKRTRHEGSQRSKGTVKLATTSRTVLFAPIDPSTNLRKINRQLLSDQLQALAPKQFTEVGVNTSKNIIAADARSEAGVLELLILNKIGGVAVRAFLPRAKNTRAGVITDVDTTTTEDRLTTLIDSGVRVIQECVNCHQAHAATSPDCPRLKTERETCQVKARQNITFLEAAKVVKDQRKNKRHSDQQSRKLGAGIALPRGQTTTRETDPGVQDSLRPSGMAKTTIPDTMPVSMAVESPPHRHGHGHPHLLQGHPGHPSDPAEGTSNPRRLSGVETWSNRTKTAAAGSSMQSTMGKVINLVFTTLRRLLELLPRSEFRTTLRSLLSLERILGTFL